VQFVDVAVTGSIIESTGKHLELEITARDAAGRMWLDAKHYEGDADVGSYKTDAALKARDPFQNVYSNIANDLVAARARLQVADLRELRQIAQRRGWEIVETYSDAGISGAKGRNHRPGLDRLLNDAQRGKFDVVMTWAIDRLGRSLIDLLSTVQHLEACHVDLYLDQQQIDTTTPTGKLMFQITGAFAEFERSMIRQRVRLGLKRAVANGKVLGRRPVEDDPEGAAKVRKARKLLAKGVGINRVAQTVGLSNGTVARLRAE